MADDIKEASYSCEVETCVVDLEWGVGSPKSCAACFEVEHVVHGCALLDLGRMCVDGREAQTCDTQVEQVCKSKQTHEPYVALDLALLIGSECVRDESLELERGVEGSFAASEPSSSLDGHRRAGCGLFELLAHVMLLTETQLRDAVIGLISAVLAVVSCSFAWMGKLGRRLRNAGLSCKRVWWNFRPRKPQKSEKRLFQISLWLKLAVFFALFVGAGGANNSPKSYDVRGDGPDPCSWTAKEPAAVPNDGTCRRQGIPEPIRQCWPGCSGISGCKASVEGFRGSVPRERTYESMAGWTDCRGAGTYNWATYFEEPWKVGPGYISKFGDVNETGKECVGQQLWNPTISAGVAYLILKTPGLPQDGLGRETLPTTMRKRSSLIFLPATSMDDEEQQDVGKRRRISAGMVTEDVERRVSERLARGSVGSFVWDSGVRDQDVAFCIREEQRNSTMVLSLLAIQTCLRVYEELKVDEARLLRLHFPSDLSPRQPALIPGVLFGEAVLRKLPRAYQVCAAEANRRIAAFRRRSQVQCHRCFSLAYRFLTPLAVAQAKHSLVAPASGGPQRH